jgi:hypothetical protein
VRPALFFSGRVVFVAPVGVVPDAPPDGPRGTVGFEDVPGFDA